MMIKFLRHSRFKGYTGVLYDDQVFTTFPF
jgi:hypothetical protein